MQPAQRPQETHRFLRLGDSRIRLPRLWLLAACLGASLFACTDNQNLTGPHSRGAARLGFAPRYTYLGGSYFGEPINRIRLTARDVATAAVVGTLVTDVDPNQQNWELALDVDLSGPIQVVVTIELINVNLTTGAETIQWSGQTAPIDVTPSRTPQTTTAIQLFQGPPSNLGVTSVVISPSHSDIEEGTTANLSAAVTGPQGAQAIWSSADPLIATVDQNGRVTALRDGVASIYAVAGPKADTATVRVWQSVAAIELSPESQQVSSVGQEATFTARVLDPRGSEIAGAQVVWSVADSSIARHVGDGRFVARANGNTVVTVASSARPSIQASGSLVVRQRVARLSIAPNQATINAIGATQAYTADAHDSNGNGMPGVLVWRSSNPAVATIDAAGSATATGAGVTEISAVAGTGADTVVARATLQVNPEAARIDITPENTNFNAIGDTITLRAVVTDANGNVIPGAQVDWSNRVAGIVLVEPNGLVRAIGNGRAEVSARMGRITANAVVVVQQTTALISILPVLDTVAVNDTLRFAAQARDARGNPFAGALLNWQSSDSSVATVDSTGLVRGLRAGTVTISARANGVFANAALVVRNRPPASVVIAPDGARINALGYTAQLLATIFDDLGHPLPDLAVTWSSLDAHVATVGRGGLVTAVANGTARIVASVNPADTVIITVQQVPAVLRIDPVEAVLNAGDSLTISASVVDSNDVAIAHPAVTYESSNSEAATVDNAGLVRARSHGNANITVSLGTLHATASIVVHAADLRVGTITTIPADTFADGGAAAFTMTIHNGGSAPAPSSKLNLALLDAATHAPIADSLVTLPLIAAGDSAVIVVTAPLLSSVPWPTSIEARVTVDALDQIVEISEANNQATTPVHTIRFQVASVVATPDSLPFAAPNQQSPITVVLRDRLGRVLNDHPVTFTSSDSTIARVDGTGLVAARRTGAARIVVLSGAAADTVVVTVAPPNLAISQWGAQLTGAFADDDSVRVRGWIRNPTPAPSGPFRYRVRLLNAASNAQIGTDIVTDVAQLAAGDSIQVDVAFDGDAITWPDSVAFELLVDSESALEESNEDDNVARTAVQNVTYGVAAVVLGVDSVTLNIPATHQLGARLVDRLGRDLRRPLTWQSSTPAIASVDANGLLTANAAGAAWIFAQSEGVRDSVHVTVRAANLVVSPVTIAPDTLVEGQPFAINSAVRNTGMASAAAFNATVLLRNAANGALIQTLNVGVSALAPGDSVPLVVALNIDNVTAWPEAVKAEVQLDSANIIPESNETDNNALSAPHAVRLLVATVVATPDSLPFDAPNQQAPISVVLRDRLGRVLTNRPVAFTSSDSTIARVDAAGMVTARRTGTTRVVVVSGTAADTVIVTVAPTNLAISRWGTLLTGAFADDDSVRVRGWIRNPTPAPSGPFRYRVRLLNAGNDAQIGTDIVTDVAQIAGGDSIQVDVAFDGGTIAWPDAVVFELLVDTESAVEESSEDDNLGRTAVQRVTYGVAQVALGADSLALNVTASHQLGARLTDRLGRDLRRAVTWQSSAPTIATVDANGLVTAIAAGAAWIYAQSEDMRDSVHVTVRAANLVISPLVVSPDTLVEGQTFTMSSKIRNTGTVGAAAFNATVRLRNAANGALLQSLNVGVFPLAAGDSVPLVVPFTIDTVTAWPDAVKAEVLLDTANIIPESNEADNTALSAPHSIRFRVATILVTPRRLDLNTTVDTGRITVVSKDRYARVLSGRIASFVSRNAPLASVDANGLVTGHGSGTTYVNVTVESRVDSVQVVVVGEPARILINHGDNQAGIVDRNLADSLSVEVVDASSQPVANAEVTWSTDGGSVPATSSTNAAGIAFARWQLGRVAGPRRVTACVAALPCVVIHGRANPDRPNRGRRRSDAEDQLVTVAQVAPNALELTVTDQFDNPTEGALVEWAVAPHHGTVSANSTLTDSLGVARVTWTMPTNKGTLLVQYSVKDNAVLVDSGSFRAHARPDRPHGGRKHKGDDQFVTVGTIAGDSLILEVTDQYGNGVPDALVNWTVNGGGTLDSSATHTDSAGLTMVRLHLGTVHGQRSVRADVMDGASVVASETFRVTGKPDKPNKQNKGAHADSQTVVVNQIAANALELVITDQYDNPVDSANVHWSLRAGHVDGSLSSAVTTTDTAGRTTVSWNVGKRAGSVFVDYVIFDTDNVTQLISGSFRASAQPGARARVRVPHDSIGSDALNDTTDVSAGTEDEFGNPRVGDSITWTSSDSTLVKVLPNGRMITRRNGQTTIIATSGPFSTPVTVGVRQRIRYLELIADTLNVNQVNHRMQRIQKDRRGNQIDSIYHEPLIWSSSDTTVVRVDRSTGVVSAVGIGFSTISAIAENDSAVIASVTVQVRSVRGNRVTPVVPTISEATHRPESANLREPPLSTIVNSQTRRSGRPIRG